MGKLGEYEVIIRDQLAKGVVEPASLKGIGKEFYMPRRPVIRETAARGAKDAPSQNDCLEPGPALRNKIYDVLVRGRCHSLSFTEDMRQAFLQVRIRERERDALRYHWLRDLHSTQVQVFSFCKGAVWARILAVSVRRSD